MYARTDALMSQAETGKIALRPSSPLWPVVTRRVRPTTLNGPKGSMSAKMHGRVLSNGLELLFREMRSMAEVSGVVLDRAKNYFREQLSKSLEHAFLLPTDPLCDIDFEIVGTEQLAAEMRDALKKQHFSPSVQSDARTLLNLPAPAHWTARGRLNRERAESRPSPFGGFAKRGIDSSRSIDPQIRI